MLAASVERDFWTLVNEIDRRIELMNPESHALTQLMKVKIAAERGLRLSQLLKKSFVH